MQLSSDVQCLGWHREISELLLVYESVNLSLLVLFIAVKEEEAGMSSRGFPEKAGFKEERCTKIKTWGKGRNLKFLALTV